MLPLSMGFERICKKWRNAFYEVPDTELYISCHDNLRLQIFKKTGKRVT